MVPIQSTLLCWINRFGLPTNSEAQQQEQLDQLLRQVDLELERWFEDRSSGLRTVNGETESVVGHLSSWLCESSIN